MAGRFSLKKFADINLNDEFFDSLKADYPGTENSTGGLQKKQKRELQHLFLRMR